MANYSTWKVNDLKAELKRRGIPQTGLRVKQNFVDRLLEDDAKQQPDDVLEPSEQPDAARIEERSERDQHAPREISTVPSDLQEPKPDEKELHEQNQDAQLEAQRDANAEKQDHTKTVEGVQEQREQQEQRLTETGEQPPQQEQQAEAAKKPEPQTAAETAASQASAEEAPAEPVEQAPGDSTTQEPTPAAPVGADSLAPVEKTAPSAPSASEVHTELSTPIPAEEALEDSRKRKRRSKSPAPTPDTIAKKARSRSASPRILLPEDTGAEGAPLEKHARGPAVALESQEPPEEHAHRPSVPGGSRSRKGAPLKQDARFRELIAPAEQEPVRPASPRDVAMEDANVEPALHDATAALYVDGLMRPLQPAALKKHLISIASAPGTSPNRDMVKDFYLDPIKTHCFVSFADVPAASRARSTLHGTVWPNERNRKSLFVDFIPEQKMQQWINEEEVSRGPGGPAPRWAVKYDRTDGGVEAVHEEADTKAAPPQVPREPAATRSPPHGPRASLPDNDRRPSGPPAADSRPQPGQGFQPLDDLFMSTTAKPKVYYQPVPREVADRRLDRFDDLIRKGSYARRGGDETRRVSFEDGDLFVDQGPEFLNRGRRGGRGRGRGFGLREGRRSRY